MIGHDHLGKLRLGEIYVQFMHVCPLWSYTENFMMIQQDLAEICEFQNKCLTGSSRVERERVERERRLIIVFGLVTAMGW